MARELSAAAPLKDIEHGDHSKSTNGHLRMWGCAAILATYSASSSTAFMPYIFGRLGFIVAPVVLGFYLSLCAYLQQKTLSIAICCPQVHSMPELARAVCGRVGFNIYQFMQIANQQLFLPCAMLFVIKSLKQIVLPASSDGYVHPADAPGALSCNVTWIFIVAGFCMVGANLQRRFGHAAGLCMVTCLFNVLQVVFIITRVYLNQTDPQRHTTPAQPMPELSLTDDPKSRAYWLDMFIALSSFGYCYVPCFIATEAMQELESKPEVYKALWLSTLYMFILYTVVGVFPVLAWGWDRKYEVLSELQGDFYGRAANIMLFVASGMDFLITSISLNQRCQEFFDPNFDPHDWSIKSCLKWFFYSIPPFMLTILMLCFLPDLSTLVGLMTAFVVPFSQLIGPATLTLLARRKRILEADLGIQGWFAVLAGFLVGIVMLVVGGASTIKSIFHPDKPLIQGNFFCDAIAG